MKAVITGGGGFLGAAIARRLLARGDRVTVVGRGRYPAVEALGAEGVSWDLAADSPGLERVFAGADVVFHTAAKAGVWGRREDFWSINVDGTDRVIAACKAAGVPRLVFTGSPSCTFDGRDAVNATEANSPYPARFAAVYSETKAVSEQRALAANGPGLATTSLRPHLIYGPGDPHLLPRVIDRARKGRLRIVGDGKNRVGITFVENAAAAHLQAADVLEEGSANAGKAYFITDAEPVLLWEWLNRFLEAVGAPPVRRHVSPALAGFAGEVLELVWRLLSLESEPPMTRFVAMQLSTSHFYDLSGARRDFGYSPPVDGEEGFRRAVEAFREQG